ncbi:CopG family transcriptional regulator [Chroococcidiopsis sp.]|uniref:CopG family transcriptional regulator n=1 Tax=Chroococcidiopsis sp. TaxID=3088168 RepID=UPI003F39AEE2
MANYKGNPDFGTKYRFDNGRKQPLSEQVATRVDAETKMRLSEIAEQKNCTVGDLMRAAIDEYLASRNKSAA